MSEHKILVPVDFSPASEKAIEFGSMLAKAGKFNMMLLHVFEDDGMSIKECDTKLKALSDKINAGGEVSCDFICEKGNIFDVIPHHAWKSPYRMMVIATHGRRGIRQKFFGADILKLLKKVSAPTIVVQENTPIIAEGIKTAIFPVGGHDNYEKKVEAMITMAGIFDPEIHVYSISKPGYEQSDKLKENVKLAEERFSEKGINFKRVAEDQNVFSVGFSKQTLKYSNQVNADLITIMANPTRDNYYFADSDKEAILVNDAGIAVLCVSNAEDYV